MQTSILDFLPPSAGKGSSDCSNPQDRYKYQVCFSTAFLICRPHPAVGSQTCRHWALACPHGAQNHGALRELPADFLCPLGSSASWFEKPRALLYTRTVLTQHRLPSPRSKCGHHHAGGDRFGSGSWSSQKLLERVTEEGEITPPSTPSVSPGRKQGELIELWLAAGKESLCSNFKLVIQDIRNPGWAHSVCDRKYLPTELRRNVSSYRGGCYINRSRQRQPNPNENLVGWCNPQPKSPPTMAWWSLKLMNAHEHTRTFLIAWGMDTFSFSLLT